MPALTKLTFWHWLVIGFISFMAADLLIISRLLPLEVWIIWFNIKAFLLFVGLPLFCVAFLYITREPKQ